MKKKEMEPNFDEYLTRVARDCGDMYRCLYCRAIFHREDEMAQHPHFSIFCEANMLNKYSKEQAALLGRSFSGEQAALLRPFFMPLRSYELLRGSFSEEQEALLRLCVSEEQAAHLMAFVSNELLGRSFSEEQAALFRHSTTAVLFSHSFFRLFSEEQEALLRRSFSEGQAAFLRRLFSEDFFWGKAVILGWQLGQVAAFLRRLFSEEQVALLRRLLSEEQEALFTRSFSEELLILRRLFPEEQAALLRRAISEEETEVDFRRYVIQVSRNRTIDYSCVHCRETYSEAWEMVDHLREAHMAEMRNSFSEEQALILEEQAIVREMFF